MRKSAVLQSLAVLVGVLLMMAIAYWHSIQVSRRFDDAMHRDIQQFSETLAHSEIPKAQGRAVASILTQVHHNTLSYPRARPIRSSGRSRSPGSCSWQPSLV